MSAPEKDESAHPVTCWCETCRAKVADIPAMTEKAEKDALDCTADDRDEKGVGRCMCSLVTATGGRCKVFPPRATPPGRVTRSGVARCPRCKGLCDADIGTPWEREDGTWEWVTVRPHLHRNTGRSTCKPKGYARRVAPPGQSQ